MRRSRDQGDWETCFLEEDVLAEQQNWGHLLTLYVK